MRHTVSLRRSKPLWYYWSRRK